MVERLRAVGLSGFVDSGKKIEFPSKKAYRKNRVKWLAEQLGKDSATVSKWCTNTSQPRLETLLQIANVLEVDVKESLNSSQEG